MDSFEPAPIAKETWEELDTQSRICIKALDHSMAYRFTDDEGELTPLGEGVVWWLQEVYPEADYDGMIDYLETAASELIGSLAEQDKKKDTAEYEAQQLIVLRKAQARLNASDVEDDAERDEGEQDPEDLGPAG